MRVLSTAEKEQPCFGVELIWDWRFGVSFFWEIQYPLANCNTVFGGSQKRCLRNDGTKK